MVLAAIVGVASAHGEVGRRGVGFSALFTGGVTLAVGAIVFVRTAGGGQRVGAALAAANAAASWPDHGQSRASRRILRRAWRAIRPDWCSNR